MGELSGKDYRNLLEPLAEELNAMHRWLQHKGHRLVILFEGRDTAGKGGAIEAFTDCLNPRSCRVVALTKPTERERTQWYFQRYIEHLPAAGEIALFDRSWYNRAGVERVMGFCTEDEYQQFLVDCPAFERMLVKSGILLYKYWFGCDQKLQEERLAERIDDPVKRWKISPIDLAAREKYREYTLARDEMFKHTHISEAPWTMVDMNHQKRGRLNMVRHLLDALPDHEIALESMQLQALKSAPKKESYPKSIPVAKARY